MKRTETIKNSDYFSSIIKTGKYIKNDNFVIYYIYTKDSISPKFGVAIKKNIGKAVVRNKLKRQARSLIDLNKKEFKNNTDYIIMIRNNAVKCDFKTLKKDFESLLERIH